MRSWSRTFSIVRMHTVANSGSTAAVISRMTEGQVGAGRIDSQLDPQRAALAPGRAQLFHQPLHRDDLRRSRGKVTGLLGDTRFLLGGERLRCCVTGHGLLRSIVLPSGTRPAFRTR